MRRKVTHIGFSDESHWEIGQFRIFNSLCKQQRSAVSLKSNRGLWTPNPVNPLNFWMYEPQHPEDRAPTKVKRFS